MRSRLVLRYFENPERKPRTALPATPRRPDVLGCGSVTMTTTHTLIRELPWSSRSSHTPGLEQNGDGSTDTSAEDDRPVAPAPVNKFDVS